MNILTRKIFICIVLSFMFSSGYALTVPHVFGDYMVLQTGQKVPIWGWDKPGVTVTVRFAGQEKHATASLSDGRWQVRLNPLAVSTTPRELTIRAGKTITFKDVLVGEVWLWSGQSNMQKPLGAWRGQPVQTINAEREIANANYPLIRFMKTKIYETESPSNDFDTAQRANQDYPWKGWVFCSPTSIDEVKFSAVGYFFGRKLFQELKIPIGLIEASAGGSSIEAWTPSEGFASDTELADFVIEAKTPKVTYKGTRITTLFNGMIHPLIPFALRGVLWYQGESNLLRDDGAIYTNKMIALIRSWRACWGRESPFYYVQLPPLLYSARINQVHVSEAEPAFWEAQTKVLKLSKTGMVVTTDVGDINNMHPPRKKEVGERLALWALAKDYGRKNVEPSGPMFKRIKYRKSKAVLQFYHVDGGLISKDGQPLTWFTAAGSDGKYFSAKASITRNTIIITCPQVLKLVNVRFAWDETANSNFFNKTGLPAVPFRTDSP